MKTLKPEIINVCKAKAIGDYMSDANSAKEYDEFMSGGKNPDRVEAVPGSRY